MVEVKSSDTLFMGHFNFKPITPSETLDPWGFFYLTKNETIRNKLYWQRSSKRVYLYPN
jgi:hypothetical protein